MEIRFKLIIWLCLGLGASASSAEASQDGVAAASLAYVSIRTGDPQIWVRDEQGVEHMLTDGNRVNVQPALARDGRLAFVAREVGIPRVFVMNQDGTGKQRVSSDLQAELAPSWSPDGRSLAYHALNLVNGDMHLRIADLQARTILTVPGNAKPKGPAAPSWSADGQWLSFLGKDDRSATHVWVVQRDGSGLRNISSKAATRGAAWAELSPDGKKVVWVADMREKAAHILVTELASGDSIDLTFGLIAAHESPRWSPDGRQILFSSTRDDPVHSRSDVFVMSADGRNLRNLTGHPSEDFDAKWSSDGKKVVFASLRSGTSLLYEIDLASGETQGLTQHGSHDMDHSIRPQASLQERSTHSN
jgi:TolB protein